MHYIVHYNSNLKALLENSCLYPLYLAVQRVVSTSFQQQFFLKRGFFEHCNFLK